VKIGPDTFTISTSASPGKGGIPAAKKIAYQEAARECMAQAERELFVLSEKSSPPSWTEGMANIEINFRCLLKTYPEFLRQNLKSAPDKIIEMRDR
jgi:hypothetical protein